MKIFYLCDRRACEKCNAHCGGEAQCKHTTDIRHARNFELKGESIWEIDEATELWVDGEIRAMN